MSLKHGLSTFQCMLTVIKFDGSCLKQGQVTFTTRGVLNFYIAYEINLSPYYVDDNFALGNSLFGAAKLANNKNLVYFAGGFLKSVTIFGVDNSSSAHADNREKDNLILGKCSADGLDDNTITAEAEYKISFSEQENKFCFKSTLQ